MVTDRQVRRLMELIGKGMNLGLAAAKADMDEKKVCGPVATDDDTGNRIGYLFVRG